MIHLNNIHYRSLSIEELQIPPGITSIIGRNGSGKTTLLKICAGILVPDSGTILMDNRVPRDEEVGWVNEFPERNILFETVGDEIASSLRFRHVPCGETDARVHACMESMGIASLKNRSMHELSVGEKIVVSLAAALVHDPRILVLDEFDSHLDANLAQKVERFVRRAPAEYILRCTQDMETAARSETVICLRNGEVVSAGKPEYVFPSLHDTSLYPISWRCRT